MALLLETDLPEWMTNKDLLERVRPTLPDADIRLGEAMGNRDDITMLVCVTLPKGLAQTLPNLKAVQKMGAGVDSIVTDPDLPPHVQVARFRPDIQAQEIAEYCLTYVLNGQRQVAFYFEKQRAGEWAPLSPRRNADTTVAVLGLGHIGGRTARLFASLGFRVLGWSRSAKEIDGVECRPGVEALRPMLAEADYVAAILPSTELTRGLIDYDLLCEMKPTATLINAGRGDLIVEPDLVRALDEGKLGHAVLDVFAQEPLPEDHRFWDHPRITMTPHVSGWHVGDEFRLIGENYQRLCDGRPILNTVDREKGY